MSAFEGLPRLRHRFSKIRNRSDDMAVTELHGEFLGSTGIAGLVREARADPSIPEELSRRMVEEAVTFLVEEVSVSEYPIGRYTRPYAAESLGQIGDARAVPALVAAMAYEADLSRTKRLRRSDAPNYWATPAAAWALGEIGDATAIQPLIDSLEPWGVDSEIANDVAGALVKLRASQAFAPLLRATQEILDVHSLFDLSLYFKGLLHALWELGDPAHVRSLSRALASGDEEKFRREVESVLHALG